MEKSFDWIAETMNPFSGSIGIKHLFNIATWETVQIKTVTFLLDVEETGMNAWYLFIEDCAKDSNRFSRLNRTQKVKNVTT